MIAQLTGTLLESTMDTVVLDVHGVGYELLIPLSTAEHLPMPPETVTLFTYLAVREDALTLYGFLTRDEKRLFSLIVNDVKGFGPRLALSVLSAMSISTLCAAVASKDIKLLSKINGVGKKSAEQLVLDLRGKLAAFGGALPTGATPAASGITTLNEAATQAVTGLTNLGFKHDDAEKVVRDIIDSSSDQKLSAEALIKRALSQMTSAKTKE